MTTQTIMKAINELEELIDAATKEKRQEDIEKHTKALEMLQNTLPSSFCSTCG